MFKLLHCFSSVTFFFQSSEPSSTANLRTSGLICSPTPPKPEQPDAAQADGEGDAAGEKAKKAPAIEWGPSDETHVELLTEETLAQALESARAAAEKPQEEAEKEAEKETEKAVPRAASLLLMVYAPWCSYCKQLQPAFVEAAQTLANENVSALILPLSVSDILLLS